MTLTGIELLERIRGLADDRGRVGRDQLLKLIGARSVNAETRLWLRSKNITIGDAAVVDQPVGEPVVNEPVVDELVVDEPVASELVVDERVAHESTAKKPVIKKPAAETPASHEPVAVPLTLYLREIGQHRLLAAHEERDLARTMDEQRVERTAAVFRWPRARRELLAQAAARDNDPVDFVQVGADQSQTMRRRLRRLAGAAAEPREIAALGWREGLVAPWAAELRYRYRLIQREEDNIRQACVLLGGMSPRDWGQYAPRAVDSDDWLAHAEAVGDLRIIDRDALVAAIAGAQARARDTLSDLGLSLDELRTVDQDVRRSDHAARRARSLLIRSNLRLVVSIARRASHRGVALDDLIQEGNIGLMRAIDKFDWRLGYKLSTYATWWIRQAVNRAIQASGRTVRLPGQVVDEVRKLAAVTERLLHAQGRAPSVARLASELHLDPARIRELQALAPGATSLDESADDGANRHGMLADGAGVAPDVLHELDSVRNAIEQALPTLAPEAATVVRLRYGLGTGEHSVVEIARQLNLPRARVRGLEQQALVSLRGQLGDLRDWL